MAVSPDPTLAPGAERLFHRLPLISVLLACVFPGYCLVVGFSGGWSCRGHAQLAPTALSVAAIFHSSRKEWLTNGGNTVLLLLAAFLVLGRWVLAPFSAKQFSSG